MKEASFYKKIKDKQVICQLCPHLCKLKDGEVGICQARENIDGSLYSLNYGEISALAYDRIEKKPLKNFHPGTNIFSIGSFGCNLSCPFCQNWSIAHERPATRSLSDEELISLAKAKGSIGLAYTYNEPSIWYEYVFHLSKVAKKEGLVNVLVTNGYINQKPLEEILPFIDGMNIDLKSISNDFYKDICGGSLKPVLSTIEKAASQVHVEVSYLLIEGLNSEVEEIRKMARTLAEIDRDLPLHISRYFPAYKMDRPATSLESLVSLAQEARKYLNYVYLGNVF